MGSLKRSLDQECSAVPPTKRIRSFITRPQRYCVLPDIHSAFWKYLSVTDVCCCIKHQVFCKSLVRKVGYRCWRETAATTQTLGVFIKDWLNSFGFQHCRENHVYVQGLNVNIPFDELVHSLPPNFISQQISNIALAVAKQILNARRTTLMEAITFISEEMIPLYQEEESPSQGQTSTSALVSPAAMKHIFRTARLKKALSIEQLQPYRRLITDVFSQCLYYSREQAMMARMRPSFAACHIYWLAKRPDIPVDQYSRVINYLDPLFPALYDPCSVFRDILMDILVEYDYLEFETNQKIQVD